VKFEFVQATTPENESRNRTLVSECKRACVTAGVVERERERERERDVRDVAIRGHRIAAASVRQWSCG